MTSSSLLLLLGCLPGCLSSTFTFFAGPADHTTARAHCQQLGGDLASIHSEADNVEAYVLIWGSERAHIGLTATASEGRFVWSDGTPVDYTNWADLEPTYRWSGGSDNGCALMSTEAHSRWNDAPCSEKTGFLCKWPAPPPYPPFAPGEAPLPPPPSPPDTLRPALTTLYEATGGAAWSQNAGWLNAGTVCEWHGVLCSDGRAAGLMLQENGLMGTVPTELGLLAGIHGLSLGGNSLSGTIPSEIGRLSDLTGLDVEGNSMSGVLPTETGLLSGLTWLHLGSNPLTGVLPSELGLLSDLRSLDVHNSFFRFPPPPEVDALCTNASCGGLSGCSMAAQDCPKALVDGKFCQIPAAMCGAHLVAFGLVAHHSDCSAFGDFAKPSLADPNSCNPCKQGAALLVFLPVVILIVACVAATRLRRTARISSDPNFFRRALGTFAILYYHCLNVSLVISMDIKWPPTMLQLGRMLSLDDLISLPNVECSVPAGSFGDGQDFHLTMMVTCAKFFIVMVVQLVIVCIVKCPRADVDEEGRDERVGAVGLLLIFVFLSMWRTVDEIGLMLLFGGSQTVFGESQTSWPREVFLMLVALTVLVLLSLLGAAAYLRHHVGEYADDVADTLRHRYATLSFFVHRFAVKKWQFTLWLRQLLLLIISSRTISAAVGQTHTLGAFQLCLSLAVVLYSIVRHWRRRPYLLGFHDTLELGLLAVLALLLLLAIPCQADEQRDLCTEGSPLDILMPVLFLGSLIGVRAFAWRQSLPLSLADEKIDVPVAELLRKGTIRLLSCRWLMEEAEDALPKAPSGLPVLQRRQDMPEAAFMTKEKAAELFDKGTRQVLVLSYGCAPLPPLPPAHAHNLNCCAWRRAHGGRA